MFYSILFQRHKPFKNQILYRLLSWSAGWSAAVHLSKAFDPPNHMSLRSRIINWAGFAIVILLLMGWQRTSKKSQTLCSLTLLCCINTPRPERRVCKSTAPRLRGHKLCLISSPAQAGDCPAKALGFSPGAFMQQSRLTLLCTRRYPLGFLCICGRLTSLLLRVS